MLKIFGIPALVSALLFLVPAGSFASGRGEPNKADSNQAEQTVYYSLDTVTQQGGNSGADSSAEDPAKVCDTHYTHIEDRDDYGSSSLRPTTLDCMTDTLSSPPKRK